MSLPPSCSFSSSTSPKHKAQTLSISEMHSGINSTVLCSLATSSFLAASSDDTCGKVREYLSSPLHLLCLMLRVGVGTGEAAGPKISFAFCTQHPLQCPVPRKTDNTVVTTTEVSAGLPLRSWGECGLPAAWKSWEDHCLHQQLPVQGPVAEVPGNKLARMLLMFLTLSLAPREPRLEDAVSTE